MRDESKVLLTDRAGGVLSGALDAMRRKRRGATNTTQLREERNESLTGLNRMPRYFARREECAHHTIFPGVDIFTMSGQQVTLSYVEFEPRAVVPMHSHPHEQIGMLLEGELNSGVA